MAEDKAGKATAHIGQLRCGLCEFPMGVWDDQDGKGRYYSHDVPKTIVDESWVYCPNAGKRFKVKTVELEEL
jgi:hypothetical protein